MVNIRPIPTIVPDGLQRRKSNVFAQSKRFPSPKLGKLLKGLTNSHHLPVLTSVVAKQVVSVGCQPDAVDSKSATGATNASATPGSSSAKPNTSKGTSTAQNQN